MASAIAAAKAGDYGRALLLWEPLARAGNARAQNNIGACFAEGLGVERDLELAVQWLTSAADGGDPVAQRNLAALWFKGEGVERDELRAAALYRSAAEQGDGPAQDMLSWMLLEGDAIAARCRRGPAICARRRRAGNRRGDDAHWHALPQCAWRRTRSS